MKTLRSLAVGCLFTGLIGLLSACMPGAKTFNATTRGDGHLPASDSAAASQAIITRVESVIEVQAAYRFDLRHLVDVDQGFTVTADSDEAGQTRDEAVITKAIHGAFGMGTFNPILDRLDTPFVRDRAALTRVGKPFFIRSFSSQRDDYWIVPVFYKDRWAVASHVGVTPRGMLYSNGFTVPNMTYEASGSTVLWGRDAASRWAATRLGAVRALERVYLDRMPLPRDAVLAYVWWVRAGSASCLVTVEGARHDLAPGETQALEAGAPLATVSFEPTPSAGGGS